jgi:hypothetical protein
MFRYAAVFKSSFSGISTAFATQVDKPSKLRSARR